MTMKEEKDWSVTDSFSTMSGTDECVNWQSPRMLRWRFSYDWSHWEEIDWIVYPQKQGREVHATRWKRMWLTHATRCTGCKSKIPRQQYPSRREITPMNARYSLPLCCFEFRPIADPDSEEEGGKTHLQHSSLSMMQIRHGYRVASSKVMVARRY